MPVTGPVIFWYEVWATTIGSLSDEMPGYSVGFQLCEWALHWVNNED